MLQVARLAPIQLGESSDLVAGFLLGRLNPDGGFQNRSGDSDLYYTVFGLEGLIALQHEVPAGQIVPFLESFGDGEGLDFVHLACLARAWAGLSGVYHIQIIEGSLDAETGAELQREAVEHAVSLAPEDPVVLNRLSRYHSARGDQTTAEAVWRMAFNADPNHPLNLGLAAGRLAESGELDRAIELQDRAAQLDPLGLVNRVNLAHYLFAAGRYEEAERELRVALSLAGEERADLLADAAKAELMTGKPQAALETVNSLPPGPARWQVEAMAWHRLGDGSRAAEAVEALRAQKDLTSALLLAEVHAYRGEPDQAARWLETADAHLHPDMPLSETFKPLTAAQFSPILRGSDDPRIAAWIERTIGHTEERQRSR